MLTVRGVRAGNRFLIRRIAQFVGRIGLAMLGGMCGTFVAAYLARANIDMINSVGFVASMLLIGTIGFYLGIDIPRIRASRVNVVITRTGQRADPVELLSATGTFLAATAALTSVYAIVLDDTPLRMGVFMVGSSWLLGVAMQTGAGIIGRMRLAKRAFG
jgi:hypothetical protein